MTAKEKLLAAFKDNISDENYQQLETMLAENNILPRDVYKLFKIKDMTSEMIDVYLDKEVAKLFPRDGFYNWDGYEHTLSNLLSNPNIEIITKRKYDETWYEKYYTYFTVNGKFYKYLYRSPHSFSGGGSIEYSIEEIAESDVPSKITHVAAVIGISETGHAYVIEDFGGTINECENWLDKAISRHGNKVKYRIFEA